ncbi:unnamed protein product [Paramecium octaurelia]|uniref:NACHT domain-containing protein n=1 Tax=Paramecium octaurelia TaxID=43137 RepID=A0A8S1Y6B5_PAROT|nr:unnamed protein product [Paramecium octaurelia]
MNLRGGGCGSSHIVTPFPVKTQTLKNSPGLTTQIKFHCDRIARSMVTVLDQENNLMNSFQFFQLNQRQIWNLVTNVQLNQSTFELVSQSLDTLVSALQKVIQQNVGYALYVLQIMTQLLWIMFMYYTTNQERYLDIDRQQLILREMGLIKEQLKIERSADKLFNNLYFEFFITKSIITIQPTNSKEGQEIAMQFLSGALKSLSTFTLNDDLIQSLKKSVIYIYQEGVKYSRKRKLEVIFALQQLKFYIIDELENGKDAKYLATVLSRMYCEIIRESTDWEIWCSWIQVLSQLFSLKQAVDELRIQNQLCQYFQGKEYTIPNFDGRNYVSINYFQIQNDELLKLIFESSQPLQELSKLQYYLLNGYGLLQSYEQYYFNKLSVIKATNSTLKNNSFSSSQISQFMNSVSAIQQGQQQLIELFKQLVINNDQQKIKEAEDLMKDLITKTIQLKRNLEYLAIIQQSIQGEINYNEGIYEFPETDKIQVMFLQKYLNCQLSSKQFQHIDFDSIFQENAIQSLLDQFSTEEISIELREDILKKTINQVQIDNLIVSLKMKKPQESAKNNADENKWLKGFYNALDLTQKTKCFINWNLQIQVILSIKLRMTNSFKEDEKQLNLKQEIIQLSMQMISYDSLQSSLQFMYNQFLKCQSSKILSKIPTDQSHKFVKILKAITIEKFITINQIIGILTTHLFKETKLKNDVSIDQEICKIVQEELTDNINYLNQICNGIKMITDILKNQLDNNSEQKDDLIILRDQSIFHEIFPNFNTNSILQSQIVLSFQKLSAYQDEFLKSFEIMKDYIKNEDNDFYQYLENKKAAISNIIELIDIVKLMKITNEKDKEIAFYLCEDIQKQLSECCKIVKSTSVKIEQKQFDWNEEIKFYEQLVDEMKQIKTRQQEQVQQFQNIFNNSEKVQSQILNMITLQKLAAKKPQFYQQFQESEQFLQESMSEYCNQTIEIAIDYQQVQQIISVKEFNQYPSDLEPQIYFILSQIENKDESKKSNDYFDLIQQGINDLLSNNQWRIRQFLVYELIQMRRSCLQQNCMSLNSGLYIRFQVYETDKRIRSLFDDKSIQLSNQLMGKYWPSQETIIQNKLKERLKDLNELAQQISIETQENFKQQLRKEYTKLEKDIQQMFDNVSQIQNTLGITIIFLQDLKQDLQRIENYIIQMQETLDQISKDIKYLKGRTIYELLELRMKKILQQRLVFNSDNVYIPIKSKEKLSDSQYSSEKTNLFTEDIFGDGEINEFIWKQSKDSFLIHGQAGSGKSTAARKIEEFLWMFYQKNKKSSDYIPLIPIFVQLPQLRDPVYCCIEETLKSDNYRFNERQIQEFQEAVEQRKIKLVIIMDSYDELKSDYIGLNLNVSNKLSKWRCQADKNKFPKIISTCRSEIFNIAGYNTWFLSESNSPQFYKEVKLLKFNQEQQKLYIDQYTILCVKRDIREFYFSNYGTQDYSEYETFFTDLVKSLNLAKMKFESTFMLNPNIIQQILFKCSNFVSKEMQKTLSQLLAEIWSSAQYLKFIQIMKLDKVIETPFMAEIVMAVLPYIVRQRSEINNVKNRFIKKYIYFAKSEYQLLQVNQLEKQALDEWQTIIHNSNFLNEYLQEFSEIQVDKLITKHFTSNQKFTIIKNSLMLEPLSTYDFYSQFLEHYFKRQIYKLREAGEPIDYEQIGSELWRFTHHLANQMTFQNMTQVYFQPSGLIFKKLESDWKDEFFDDQCQEGVYKRLFRKCMPIKQKNSIYSFNHKSIQEFLVAKWFVEYLSNIKFPIDENAKKQLFQYEFFKRIWEYEYLKGSITFICDKLKYNEEQKQQLLNFIYLTRTDDNFIIAGSNSMLLLNEMDHSFIDMDLSNIKIADVSLSGANFFNCDFTSSNFKGINLSSVNLNLSKVVNAQWTDISLNQLPKINTNLGNIKGLTYIEKEKLLLAFDDQKPEMKQYDIYKIQEVNKLNIKIIPKQAILANNQRIMALVNENEILLFDLFDMKMIQLIQYGQCFDKERTCCVFGYDDKSLIFGGYNGAHELKINIEFVERKASKKVTDKDKKKGKQQNQKQEAEDRVEIIQQQKDMVVTIDSFKQLISEQIVNLQCCKIIIMQRQSKTINLYSQQTQLMKQIETKCERVICMDSNLELNLLAIGGRKGEIYLYNLSQIEKPVNLCGHKKAIAELKFSNDGKILVSCSFDQSIILWSTQQLSQINQANFTAFIKIFSLTLITNSYLAVTGQNQGQIQIWDLNSQDTSISNPQGHLNTVQCCIFSFDGALLISGSSDLLIKIWSTQTGQQIGQNLEKHQLPIRSLAISQDSNLLCSGGEDGYLYIWDLQNFQIRNEINHYASQISKVSIFYSEDQYKIVTLTEEKLIHLWSLNNLQEFLLIYDYKDENKRLIPNIETKKLLDQCRDQQVNVIESYNISNYLKIQNQYITALAISNNGLQKLIGTSEGYLLVVEDKELIFKNQAHKKSKCDVIYVLNNKLFMTSGQNSIIFWKFSDFTQYSNYQSKFTKINDFFVWNDNLYISIDQTIRIWNISQKSTIKVIKEKKKDHIHSICMKNSNTIYAGTQNGNLLIIDLQKSDQYQVIPEIHNGRITKIAWINNQNVFITAGLDGILKQWKDDKPIKVIDTGSTINSFYLSNDQNYFVLHTFEGLSMWISEDLVLSEKIVNLNDNQSILVLFNQRRIIWSKDDQLFYVPILQKKLKYSYAQEPNNHFPTTFLVDENNTIYSGDKDGKLGFWNYKGEKTKDFLDLNQPNIICLSQSPDKSKLVVVFKELIKVISAESFEIIYEKDFKDFSINSLNYLNEKTLLITNSLKDKQVIFYDEENKQMLIENEHDEEVNGAAVNLKLNCYATYSNDKSIRYYQKQNSIYSMKYSMSQLLKFESQDTVVENSTIISKTGIDLLSLFKNQRIVTN